MIIGVIIFSWLTLVFAREVVLPPSAQAEGIAHAAGSLFFVAEFRTGAVFLVDVATGFASTLVRPAPERVAVGLAAKNGSLFVSGGGMVGNFGVPPRMLVYDILSGNLIADCLPPKGAVVNDVTADETFAYYTDSARGQVYRLRLAALPQCEFDVLELPPESFPRVPGVFTANGIVRFASGLVVVNSDANNLFFVDLHTKSVQQLLPRNAVVGADGLEIFKYKNGATSTLFVVQNILNVVSIWRLRQTGREVSAQFVKNITSPDFDTPTTAALGGGRLVVANSRFTTFSFTEDLPDDAEFSLTALPIRREKIVHSHKYK
ncbi:unnamed protein product [Agarophyton chilense]|eukprot:gb/GEZJ01005054.1/.p1 GENE.gb/GEZJ01005054.1/~~gb/GEZJ01005054.1/.p1  ORF type:complete len:319 (+),score=32.06 gb/GEZJ01005054.1/:463-1419(+)